VVFLALAVPSLALAVYGGALAIAKLIIVFYANEMQSVVRTSGPYGSASSPPGTRGSDAAMF
jgi:hypothetical protein